MGISAGISIGDDAAYETLRDLFTLTLSEIGQDAVATALAITGTSYSHLLFLGESFTFLTFDIFAGAFDYLVSAAASAVEAKAHLQLTSFHYLFALLVTVAEHPSFVGKVIQNADKLNEIGNNC